MTLASQNSSPILWGRVFSLALVQGAITLAWVVYNLYLVELLTGLGFPKTMAAGLLLLENLLAMVMEPLMGSFSDRLQHRLGTRFPLISLGVILAAGCFLILPTTLIWGQAGLRWVLPLLLVAWALAMTVFRSPALSLLGRYALRSQLPQAASILTLVGGLAGSLGPLANQFILDLGPMAAFAIGSGVLLMATAALWRVGPDATAVSADHSSFDIAWGNLALVFATGAAITLGFRMVITRFPMVLNQQVPEANSAAIMGAVFLALAVTAIPSGTLATRLGNHRAMIGGLGIMTLLAALMGNVSSSFLALVLALIFGAAFSLVANGTLPFALSMVPPQRAGLGTGMYFSGGALASSLFGSLNVSVGLSFVVGAIAFAVAGVCIGGARLAKQ
mgnify:CR=1 FL=1